MERAWPCSLVTSGGSPGLRLQLTRLVPRHLPRLHRNSWCLSGTAHQAMKVPGQAGREILVAVVHLGMLARYGVEIRPTLIPNLSRSRFHGLRHRLSPHRSHHRSPLHRLFPRLLQVRFRHRQALLPRFTTLPVDQSRNSEPNRASKFSPLVEFLSVPMGAVITTLPMLRDPMFWPITSQWHQPPR